MQEDPLLRKCKSCHANIGSTETYCPFCWEPTGFQNSYSPPEQNANTNGPSQHTQNPKMEGLLRFSSISGPGLLLIFGLVCLGVFGVIHLVFTFDDGTTHIVNSDQSLGNSIPSTPLTPSPTTGSPESIVQPYQPPIVYYWMPIPPTPLPQQVEDNRGIQLNPTLGYEDPQQQVDQPNRQAYIMLENQIQNLQNRIQEIQIEDEENKEQAQHEMYTQRSNAWWQAQEQQLIQQQQQRIQEQAQNEEYIRRLQERKRDAELQIIQQKQMKLTQERQDLSAQRTRRHQQYLSSMNHLRNGGNQTKQEMELLRMQEESQHSFYLGQDGGLSMQQQRLQEQFNKVQHRYRQPIPIPPPDVPKRRGIWLRP